MKKYILFILSPVYNKLLLRKISIPIRRMVIWGLAKPTRLPIYMWKDVFYWAEPIWTRMAAHARSWVGFATYDLGNALHYLGDSYAHSMIGNEVSMYPNGRGHLFDGHDPDKIALRPELYKRYTRELSSAMAGRFGFKGSVDMFTFDYIAGSRGSTEQNSAILETEIRIREGASSFSVEGNQVGAIGDYMRSSNQHFGRKVGATIKYADVDMYKKNADGEWEKDKTETRTFVKFN